MMGIIFAGGSGTEAGVRPTIASYVENEAWAAAVLSGAYPDAAARSS